MRVYTDDYRPVVGAKVTTTFQTARGMRLSEGVGPFVATVSESYLAPTADTPLDEGVWQLLDEYNGYPEWIARLSCPDNLDGVDGLLVGPDEIEEAE